MLTRKQAELLKFISEHLGINGVSPSFDEMKDALGLKSKSGIHRLITGLEERKFIRRLPHRARALEILRMPPSVGGDKTDKANGTPDGVTRFSAKVISGGFAGRPLPEPRGEAIEAVELPLYGRIAAGTPIEALRDHSASVEVPASMLGGGDYYALEVEGDSMIDAGILSGDTIIIRRADTAENGGIVVALIDDNEVTLKRLRRKGHSVALEPANKAYETRIFGPDRVKIQGCLKGLIRAY